MAGAVKRTADGYKARKSGYQQNRAQLSLTTPEHDNYSDPGDYGYSEIREAWYETVREMDRVIHERGKI
jgi:hypothetical protein